MPPPTVFSFARQRIIVADEDPTTAAFMVETLKRDRHAVARAAHVPGPAQDTGLEACQLLISGIRANGVGGADAVAELLERRPALPVLYLASADFTPTLEAELSAHVAILRRPFTAEELRAAVRPLLPRLRDGTVFGPTMPDQAGSL